jgi:hypothetical protein
MLPRTLSKNPSNLPIVEDSSGVKISLHRRQRETCKHAQKKALLEYCFLCFLYFVSSFLVPLPHYRYHHLSWMFTKVKSGVITAEDKDLFQALVGGFEGASSSATISLNYAGSRKRCNYSTPFRGETRALTLTWDRKINAYMGFRLWSSDDINSFFTTRFISAATDCTC